MSTISVRVSLLILATVMFATVWSNDHKPGPVKRRTVVAYEFPAICPVNAIEPVSRVPAETEPVKQLVSEADHFINLVASELVAEELSPLHAEKPQSVRVSELSFPLPRNLTAGEYRIIDRFGNAENLTATRDRLNSWGIAPQHDVRNAYEVCVGRDRWHFIRIERADEPAPTRAEIASAWKSVIGFTGRKLTPAIEKTSAPLTRWLGGDLDLSAESRDLR